MSQLVTSSQCASQQNKRGLCLVFLAVLAAPVRGRKSAQRLMYPFGFQFNSDSLFTYSNFPVWAFVRRKTFWFVLPTLYLYYCLEWEHSVSSCRISGDLASTPNLWRYLKCIVFTKTPVPSLSFLSFFPFPPPLSPSPHCVSPSLPVSPLFSFSPYLCSCRTLRERASWTSFMPFRTCASACRMHWMKWPPTARG